MLETDKLFAAIAEARLSGEDVGALALRFHAELARQIAEAVIRAGEQTGLKKAALSGGVFQNRLLLELTVDRLRAAGFTVLLHSLTPTNDGGIALGQAVFAMANPELAN